MLLSIDTNEFGSVRVMWFSYAQTAGSLAVLHA